jgi:hypothetical protein
VWQTNRWYEEIRNFYIGESKDIAETLTLKLFNKGNKKKDFMITKRENGVVDIHAYIFSDESKALMKE